MFARRDDHGATSRGGDVMAFVHVTGPSDGDGGDVLIRWDLLQQVGQHWSIADIAGGYADRADLRRFLVHAETGPTPKAFPWPAMFARILRASTLGLDPARHCPRTNGGNASPPISRWTGLDPLRYGMATLTVF